MSKIRKPPRTLSAGLLASHQQWLNNETGGKQAQLHGAALRASNLRGVNLCSAEMYSADLREADLREAALGGANLYKADLRGADLRNADLRHADLSDADLRGAVLKAADLEDALLTGAILHEVDLSETRNIPQLAAAQLSIVPERGAFEGWKQCDNGVMVRMRIPETGKRSNSTSRLCRAEFVVVLATSDNAVGISEFDSTTTYAPGKTVRCLYWEPNRWVKYDGGIHFYLTWEEAAAEPEEFYLNIPEKPNAKN